METGQIDECTSASRIVLCAKASCCCWVATSEEEFEDMVIGNCPFLCKLFFESTLNFRRFSRDNGLAVSSPT